MNELQHIILKKLKTYKTPKTARQLYDVLAPKHRQLNSIQQLNGNLYSLWVEGHVHGSDTLPRRYSARSR